MRMARLLVGSLFNDLDLLQAGGKLNEVQAAESGRGDEISKREIIEQKESPHR
jgi:hypothetical protein